MPYLISSPEGFFRVHQRECVELSVAWTDEEVAAYPSWNTGQIIQHRKLLRDSVEALERAVQSIDPKANTESVGPSEYSGWISGGPGAIMLNASPVATADFVRRCIGPDGQTRGEGFEARFKLEASTFSTWKARIEKQKVVQRIDPAYALGCRWFLVEGQIYVVQSTEVVDKNGAPSMENTASLYDAWWLVKKHLPPAWQEVSHNKVLNGLVIVRQGYWDVYNNWVLWHLTAPHRDEYYDNPLHLQRLRTALNVPDDVTFSICDSEF